MKIEYYWNNFKRLSKVRDKSKEINLDSLHLTMKLYQFWGRIKSSTITEIVETYCRNMHCNLKKNIILVKCETNYIAGINNL